MYTPGRFNATEKLMQSQMFAIASLELLGVWASCKAKIITVNTPINVRQKIIENKV